MVRQKGISGGILFTIIFVITLCTTASLVKAEPIYLPSPYPLMPITADWTDLTNHLQECRNALVARYEATDIPISQAHYPTCIYPMHDYTQFAENIERICTNFVYTLDFDTDGGFEGATNIPMWTVSNLLSEIGITDWSTNGPLHSWALTSHEIQQEVTDALNLLRWTCMLDMHPNNPGNSAYWQERGYSGPTHGTSTCAEAISYTATEYYSYTWTPTSRDEKYGAWASSLWHSYRSETFWAATSWRMRFLPHGSLPTTNTSCSVDVYFLLDEENYFTRYGYEGVLDHAFVDIDGLGMPDGTLYHQQTLPIMDPPQTNRGGTNEPTAWMGDFDTSPLSVVSPPCIEAQGYAARGASADVMHWVVKWEFETISSLTSPMAEEDHDTDRDDIVNTDVELRSIENSTGTMVWHPGEDRPAVYLPLVATPAWFAGTPAYGYLSQGITTNLCYQHLLPGLNDYDGWHQAFSFNSRIVESGAISSPTNIKRVSLLRPRGSLVVFDFPWTGTNFSEIGFPVGVNSKRSYVLHDCTPADHSDHIYDLQFASGIIHHYSGLIESVSDPRGMKTRIEDVAQYQSGERRFSHAWDARHLVRVSGIIMRLDPLSIRYKSRPTLSSSTVTIICSRDENSYITEIAKSGHPRIEDSNVAHSGSTLTYGWGALNHSSSGTAGTPRTVELIREVTDCGTSVQTYTLNDADRINRQDVSFDGSADVATTLITYTAPVDRSGLPNGALLEAYPESITYPDGSWVRYTYDATTGWLSTEKWPHDDTLDFSRILAYIPHDGDSPANTNLYARPCTIIDKLGGSTTKRRLQAYYGSTKTVIKQAASASADWSTTDSLVQTNQTSLNTELPDCWLNGLPETIITPTETMLYTYGLTGVDTNGWDWIEFVSTTQTCHFVSTGVLSTGETHLQRWNAYGQNEESVVIESGYTTSLNRAVSVDNFGRPEAIEHLDGTLLSVTNYCIHGPQTIVGVDDSPSLYTYDAAGNVTIASQPALDLTATYKHDAFLRITNYTLTATSGESVSTTTKYDSMGRVTRKLDLLGETTVLYDDTPTYGSRRSTLLPYGATLVEDFNMDGSLREVSGSAATAKARYESGADSSGRWHKHFFPNEGSDAQWNKTTTSLLGQTKSIERPIVGTRQLYYDTKGRWIGSRDEVGLRHMRTYGPDNRPDLAGLDVGSDSLLAPGGQDRFQDHDRIVNADGITRKTSVYPEDLSTVSSLLSSQMVSHNGRITASTYAGMTNTSSRSLFDPGGVFSITNTMNDGSYKIIQHDKWRVSEVQQFDSSGALRVTERYTYDGLGALSSISNSVTGSTTIELDAARRIHKVIRPAPLPALKYWYQPGTYRVIKKQGPDGTETHYEYSDNGLLTRQYDSATFDLHYEYDEQGRLTKMIDARGSKREWDYESDTGRLKTKQLNDVVARKVKYRDNDQPERVLMAGFVDRAQVLGHNTKGDVSDITWTDGTTTPLTHTEIDRLGRIRETLFNGITTSIDLDLANRVTQVSAAGGSVPNQSFNYLYGAHGGIIQIDTTIAGHTNTHDIIHDDWNRVVAISNNVLSTLYAYPATDNRQINELSVTVGTVTNRLTIGRLPATGKITNMAWAVNSLPVAAYISELDTNAYRTAALTISNTQYKTSWEYTYNTAGELTNATHKTTPGGTDALGMHYRYAYDAIGNTTNAGFLIEDEPAHTFIADYRDVHISRQWGNQVEIMGMAASGTGIVVTVNDFSCEREGDWFRCVLTVDNPIAVEIPVTVRVVSNDVVAEATGILAVPAAEESPVYSVVDNLVQDSCFQYRFDGYGRLMAASNATHKITFGYYAGGQRASKTVAKWEAGTWITTKRHDFVYDRWNLVYERITDDPDEAATVTECEYLWGLDLDGQQNGTFSQGAAGIAGLLGIIERTDSTTNTYLTIHDQIGSIRHVIDGSTGNIVAGYEYSPFGELIGEWGTRTDLCPFRFSTRYYDVETDLYYYGYRYYNPRSTKWLTTDPLEESGGINLTTFCNNDPINSIDKLGLAAYFFGGTGNSLDVGQRSSVEILYEAWDQPAHGNPYYVPGVMSGRTPEGDKTKRKWYYLWLSRGQISEGAAGRTLGSRADKMIEHLEKELAGGDKEINLFGFSRGSTTALEFLNKIQANRSDPKKKTLYAGIKLNFIALWDTVDTTAASYHTELPKGMKFEHKPLHFISLDEQRAQFFNNNVLNIEGALQIGYRGVHADVGGFVYPKKANFFGDFSRNDAVMAAGLIGINFHQATLNASKNPINWKAIPTENSSIIYKDNETRTFPSDMYLHWSVGSFGTYTTPYNSVDNRKAIGWREWYNWAGKHVP